MEEKPKNFPIHCTRETLYRILRLGRCALGFRLFNGDVSDPLFSKIVIGEKIILTFRINGDIKVSAQVKATVERRNATGTPAGYRLVGTFDAWEQADHADDPGRSSYDLPI